MDLGTFQAQNRGAKRGNTRGKQHFHANQPNNNNKGDWRRNAVCHYCGKKGHIKPDCRSYLASTNANPKGGAIGKPAGQRGKLSLVEQVAQLSAELAAMKAAAPSTSKNWGVRCSTISNCWAPMIKQLAQSKSSWKYCWRLATSK